MEAISQLDLTHYALMGEMVDIREAAKAFDGTSISQLFDFRLLRDGSPEQIILRTKEMMERADLVDNYCIAVEGQQGVPLEKARLVRDAVLERR